MSRYDGYHTALAEPATAPEADLTEFDDGCALRYDIFSRSYPEIFRRCDVFYSDLPWRSGFQKFEDRAGFSGRSYAEFLACVQAHVAHYGKPVVFVTGKHAVEALRPDRTYPTTLNANPAMAMCWGVSLNSHRSERSILHELARRFDCAGDYCCGYGRTGQAFRDQKKRFVMSDYNAKCIGYIRENFT